MYLVNQKKTIIVKMKNKKVEIKKEFTAEMVSDARKYRAELITNLTRFKDFPTQNINPEPFNGYNFNMGFNGSGITLEESNAISKKVDEWIEDKYGQNAIRYSIVCDSGRILLGDYPDLSSAEKEMKMLIEAISRGDKYFEFTDVLNQTSEEPEEANKTNK